MHDTLADAGVRGQATFQQLSDLITRADTVLWMGTEDYTLAVLKGHFPWKRILNPPGEELSDLALVSEERLAVVSDLRPPELRAKLTGFFEERHSDRVLGLTILSGFRRGFFRHPH